MDLREAFRPKMWNVQVEWPMYAMFGVALVIFAVGMWRHLAIWRQGKADNERLGDWARRAGLLVKELIFQNRVRGSVLSAWFHSFIYYSFGLLALTTTVVALDYDLGMSLFHGWFYVVLKLGSQLGGLLILVGIGIAALRRLVTRPPTLDKAAGDLWALAILAGLVLTGFLLGGLRIAAIGDRWAFLSPISWGLATLMNWIPAQTTTRLHAFLWWLHAALAMSWIAAIPYTKFFHFLALPSNVFFRKLGPRGALQRIDVEAAMSADDFDESSLALGVGRARDFTWKQRLDFDACVSCGRCEEACPAFLAGEPFSPKRFVHAGRDALRSMAGREAGSLEEEGSDAFVGTAIEEDFVWYCRTCSECVEVCPAAIDHVDSMIEVRRNELMMQGRVPPTGSRALKLLESQGNPFDKRQLRAQWVKEMGFPVVPRGGEVEVLYWIGCLTTFDPTKQHIARDVVKLLEAAGISYGVLGSDENCCGDPARLLGDERLFQQVAKDQAAAIQTRSFRTLLVSCPHCLNVLGNEYPQFGATFRVKHHSEFLQELLAEGRLRTGQAPAEKLVYHDPCYLGRYQKCYDPPRRLLEAIPGPRLAEMADSRERSLCCGGGGGHYWMDLKVEGAERVGSMRVDQAEAAGAQAIVTACPYCHQMLNDGLKARNLDKEIRIVDIASHLAQSIGS